MIKLQDLPVVPLPDKTDTGKGAFEALKGLSFDDAISVIANGIVQFSFRLLGAILVFYVGKFLIKKIFGVVRVILERNEIDASLSSFVLSLVRIGLYFLLIILCIGILGVETSAFVALLASAGLAVSMAMSGTLQNFAGGVLIILLKPYKVGDYIEAQGFTGTVKEIQIFHTVINTMDNKTIIIPNGGLSTGSINNYSIEDYRRVDWEIGLTYGFDYTRAKQQIIDMLLSDERVVEDTLGKDIEKRKQKQLELQAAENDCPEDDPDCEKDEEPKSWFKRFLYRRKKKQIELKRQLSKKTSIKIPIDGNLSRPPFVGLKELGDSSVVLTIRAWTHKTNYWDLFFEMNERFYKELPAQGFDFPFPQLDVHLPDMPELTVVNKQI